MDTTELGLLRRDFTPALRDACERLLCSSAAAETYLGETFSPDRDGPPLDRCLVRMVVAEHQLSRLVIPTRDAMEFFGLPRSVTGHAMDPDPTVRVQDPARESWDFRPWLSEKTTYLRDNLYALLETIETLLNTPPGGLPAPDATEPGSDVQSSAEDAERGEEEDLFNRLRERALYELRASRGYARDILGAIDTMGLSVVDWRLTA